VVVDVFKNGYDKNDKLVIHPIKSQVTGGMPPAAKSSNDYYFLFSAVK